MTTDLEAARRFLHDMIARDEATDLELLPHVIVQIDGETNTRQAIGPYPNGYTAMLATEAMRQEVGEPIEFQIMPIFPAPASA